MSNSVVDASSILALLKREPGSDQVADAVTKGAAISAVNLSEVIAKLSEAGMPEPVIRDALDPLGLDVTDFTGELAYRAGVLRPATKHIGLSLGDRACLALAQNLGLVALTADRAWSTVNIGVAVQVIR